VASTQPTASVATTAVARTQPTGTAEVRKALDGERAKVSSNLAEAVATATELDKAVLTASPTEAALLQRAAGKAHADVSHFAVADSRLVGAAHACADPARTPYPPWS
jgi:hypothetical protein